MSKRIISISFLLLFLFFNGSVGYANGTAFGAKESNEARTVNHPSIVNSSIHDLDSADFPKIHSIVAQGPFTMHIVTGASKERIVLSGIDHPYSVLNVNVEKDRLYLSSRQSKLIVNATLADLRSLSLDQIREATVQSVKSNSSKISLYLNNVDFFNLLGSFDIPTWVIEGKVKISARGPIDLGTLKSYNSESLQLENLNTVNNHEIVVNHMGVGDILLKGKINSAKIYQRGKGKINIQLKENNSVLINAYDGGDIQIVGRTHRLVANLMKNIRLDASDLPSDRIFIKTYDNAVAKVNPVNLLFAAAFGFSRINYIHEPEDLYIYPTQYGNVILSNE